MTPIRAVVGAVLGAVGAALAGGAAAATGIEVAGFGWFALFGAAVGVLLPASPTSTWLVVGAGLLVAGWGDGVATIGALAVLAAAHLRIRGSTPEPLLGAAVAALAPAAAVRLVWPSTTGSTTVIAAAVLVVAAVTGLRHLDRRVRRIVLLGGAAVGAASVAAVGAAVATGVADLRRIDLAVDTVDAGLDATRAGDAELGATLLADAADQFRSLGRELDQPWTAPGRAVPVVGRQLDATKALLDAAARLAGVGADVASTIDTDQLRPLEGRIDLAAVSDLADPLARISGSLTAVLAELDALQSPWLVSPLRDAITEFRERARDADADARDALRALDLAPNLLGADGERRWFVAIVTPAQTRGAGGYMGSYGIIRVHDGRIDLEHLGRHDELSVPTGPVGPPEYAARYAANFGLDRFAGNLTASPHFPSVAQALVDKYRAVSGQTVDGVIAMDPDAFVALLGLVGSVEVDGWPEPIDTGNARRVLLHDQYVALSSDTALRVDFLESVAEAVFDRIVGGGLPKPADVGAALTPLLPGRHIQLWSARPEEQTWFADVGASGALAPVRDDALAVILNNASRSKVDWFLHRSIVYDVHADGRATLAVRFRNGAPSSGLPAYVIGPAIDGAPSAGVNHMFVAVFTPRAPTAVTVDGQPVAFSVTQERGRNVVEAFVDIGPGSTAELRLDLEGPAPSPGYELDLDGQAMVNPDRVRVTVDGEVLFEGEQRTDLVLRRA